LTIGWPWISAVALMCLAPVYGYVAVTGRRTSLAFVFGLLLIGVLPWLLPVELPIARFAGAVWALGLGFHLADFAYDRYPDPAMISSMPRAVFTALLGPDGCWPVDDDTARRNRTEGLKRIGRGLLKQGPTLGLLAISTAWPQIHDWLMLKMFWVLWFTYFTLTAAFDILSGLAMVGVGVWANETFNWPPLATSPRNFWSRRWNLWFRHQVHRHIFVPLGGRDRPVLGVVTVFAFSAVAHEYIIIAALGSTSGHMTVFFTLHCIATLGYGIVSRRRSGRPFMPNWLAVSTHLAWFTATAWFFLTPMLQICPVHEFHLW
jgi:hypothetical protein